MVPGMAREEGVFSWYKGADASAVRCLVGTSSQLLTFSYVLDMVKATTWYDESNSFSSKAKFAMANCLAGLASGCVLSCAMQPFDTARTRLYSQPTNPDGSGKLYRTGVMGLVDAMGKTFQLEGIAGLYKGLMGNIMRQGPHMALAFLILGQFRQIYGDTVERPREVATLWEGLDQNHDGRVDVDEIKSLLREFYSDRHMQIDEEKLDQTAARMINVADTDKDGTISRDEFDVLVKDIGYVVRDNLVARWSHQAAVALGAPT